MCSLLSAVLNGTRFRASESLTFYSSQFRANTENSHGIEKMMSQHCAQDEFDEITATGTSPSSMVSLLRSRRKRSRKRKMSKQWKKRTKRKLMRN